MKIKIVYGIDMRLWQKNLTTEKAEASVYNDLLTYVCKTFNFSDHSQFRVSYLDDDDTQTTVCSAEDFNDAYLLAQKANKKSLKLSITNTAEQNHSFDGEEGTETEAKAKAPPIQSNIGADHHPSANAANPPTEEDINAFLSNNAVMELLSELFIAVFELLQSSNFEISLMECIQGVLLSSGDKYKALTSNAVWPYFMNVLLPKYTPQIQQFVIPMIQMNGAINSQSIKQWMPTILNMMKRHSQNMSDPCFSPFFAGCSGQKRGRRRGKWHRGRAWHHNRGYNRGWRGYQRGQRGAYHHQHAQHAHHPHHRAPFHQFPAHQEHDGYVHIPSAPPVNQEQDDQIEQEAFEYTEELVAIMNMGFANMLQIKQLLSEHKGNKELVVQELVNRK